MMKILYNPKHKDHNPEFEIFDGEKEAHQETSSRIENIMSALTRAGYDIETVKQEEEVEAITKVHNYNYVSFLREVSNTLLTGQTKYPSCWSELPYIKSTSELAKLGFYSSDMYTPVSRETYHSALYSANLSLCGAKHLAQGGGKIVYAICRPPGHHASVAKMGGYCYFNNSAIAADYLTKRGKVAILDIDFHHGNGTQDIFYSRDDVLTLSIHADPNWKFPYFKGFTNETGSGKGQGYNNNLVLEKGTSNNEYLEALERALVTIQNYSPTFLIVGFGTDTHEADPIGGFRLTTSFYKTMAERINQLGLPTLINQEGGYATSVIGDNVVSFLEGFK